MTAKHYDAKSFSSKQSIGYLLKLAHSLLHDAAAAAFEDHDLSFSQWLVLMTLSEGASTSTELCRVMRHDTGALTRLLDQLEARGLLDRRRSDADRRIVNVRLTADGRRKAAEVTPLVVDRLNSALAAFSKAEFAEFKRLLKKLIDSLQQMEQERAAAP